MRIRLAVLCVCFTGLLGGCTDNPGNNNSSAPVVSAASQEAKALLIQKCTFSIVDKDIRPDLKRRTDREMKQAVSIDTVGHLVCTKSLVYTPTNEDFSDRHYEVRVLLKDLDPHRLAVAGDNDNGWRIDAPTMDNKDVVTNKEGKKLDELIIWCPDKNTARQIKDALSVLVNDARNNAIRNK